MSDIDTLYDDIHDEMDQCLNMIGKFDNQRLANDFAETEIDDADMQELPGIHCLFGIELYLTAAGCPAKSKKCPIPEHFQPKYSFRFNQNLVKPFNKRIKKIAKLRIATGFPADEINTAAAAMIHRIELAVETSKNLPESPPPLIISVSSMLACGLKAPESLLNNNVPPWWNKLLLRCRDLCEEYKEPWKLRKILAGRMCSEELKYLDWKEYVCERRYFYPVIDESLVDWLHEELKETPHDCPSLLYCVIESSIFNAQPLPERVSKEMTQDYFFYVAKRVMWEAVIKQSPKGLKEFLPNENYHGRGIFNNSSAGYPSIADSNLKELLLTGWTGISGENSRIHMQESSYAAELWFEVENLGLIKNILLNGITTSNDEEIHVMHAWCAWCAKCWDEKNIELLFPDKLIGWYGSRPIEPSSYDFTDQRFVEFCIDLNKVVTNRLAYALSKQDWKSLPQMFKHYRGGVSLEIMLAIAEKISPKDSLERYENILNVTIMPKNGELKKYQDRIKSLPQATLRRLAICSGLASPMILDAIDDKQFRDLIQCILGTFSEALVMDQDEDWAYTNGNHPWYPGRTSSGITNLNPLFEAIASSSSQVWNDAIQEADRSNSLRGIGKYFLKSLISISTNKKIEANSFYEFPAIIRLTHRIPSEAEAWHDEKLKRIDNLAELLDDKDSYWLNTITLTGVKNMRIAARLYAESLGFESWQDAALEMAEHLYFPEPFSCGTYSIKQVATMPRGVTIYKGKGQQPLKSVPAALLNDKNAVKVLNRCRLFHLIYRTSVRDVVDEWIESGASPSEGYVQKFEELFGRHPLSMLTINPKVKKEVESLRAAIMRTIGEPQLQMDSAHDYETPTKVSQIVADELMHYDWICSYYIRNESHEITREFKKFGLTVIMRPKSESLDHSKFTPKKAFNFELYCGDARLKNPEPANKDKVDRLLHRLAYEIGLAGI